MRRTIWAVSLIAGILSVSAPGSRAGQAKFDRVFPLSSGGEFALVNVNGSIQVEGWEREAVEIQGVKSAKSDLDDLDQVKIEIRNDPQRVAVRTVYPSGDGANVAVDYRIHVPYRLLLAGLVTVNGNVRVSGLQGIGDLRTVNGDVQVVNSSGRFSGHTTNGDIHFQLKQMPAGIPMQISTVNGSVLLELPSDAAASLHVRSLNGAFASEFPIGSRAAESSDGFRGTLGSGGSELDVNAMNGAIRLVVDRPTV